MNDIAVYIFIAFLASGIVYLKVNKLVGSIFTIGVGIGMMFVTQATDANSTWVGLIVMMIGLVLLLTAPFSGKKKRR